MPGERPRIKLALHPGYGSTDASKRAAQSTALISPPGPGCVE